MRRGELLGLRWIDVDLTRGRVAIRQTMVMVDGKPAIARAQDRQGSPLPDAGPGGAGGIARSPRSSGGRAAVLGADYTDAGLVITTEDGRPMHPETLSGLFVRQARRVGLPPIRLHDLRHSVASILLARGVHPKVVSDLLGHATIALTLDTYSHVIPSLQQEAAGVVAAAVLDPAGVATEPASTGQVRASHRVADRMRAASEPGL
jgi:integrase